MINKFRYSRRIFRSNYPLSSRTWGAILEEIQSIFCQYFGNTINKEKIATGIVGELIDELSTFYTETWGNSDETNANFMNLLTNIKHSLSKK